MRTWDVNSLVEKEPELVHEVEGFLVDIVYSLVPGTSFLERSWALFHYGLALDQCWEGYF